MAADGKLTPQEKVDVKREWGEIQSEYSKYTQQATTYGVSATAYTTAYTTLNTYIAGTYTTNSGVTTAGLLDSSHLGNTETIDSTTFTNNFKNYYDAAIDLQNAINAAIKAAADAEIGGRNLYSGADPLTLTTYTYTGITLESGKKYVVTIGNISGNAYSLSLRTRLGSSSNYSYSIKKTIISSNTAGTDITPISDFSYVITGDGGELFFNAGSTGSGQSWMLTHIMVQKGEKSTGYQPNYDYLAEAFEHDATQQVTDINGGLIATSLIKLRNQFGAETAGISGLDDIVESNGTVTGQGVTAWGGATYAQALAAASGSGRVPILLTKTGIGSMIGVFDVNENSITVNVPNIGIVTIDANNGMSMQDANGVNRIIITPKTLAAVESEINTSAEIDTSRKTERYSDYRETSIISYQGIYNGSDYNKIHLPLNEPQTYPNVNTYVAAEDGVSMTFTIPQMILYSTGYTQYPISAASLSQEYHFRYRIGLWKMTQGSNGQYTRSTLVGCLDMGGATTSAYMSGSEDTSSTTRSTTIPAATRTVSGLAKGNYAVYIDAEVVYAKASLSETSQVMVLLQLANSYTIGCHISATTTPKTIIARDGLISAVNGDTYFKVLNTDSGQQIIAKGLSTSSSGLSSGALYKSDVGFKAFAEALVQFMHEKFTDVSKKSDFSTALDELAATLPQDDTYIKAK